MPPPHPVSRPCLHARVFLTAIPPHLTSPHHTAEHATECVVTPNAHLYRRSDLADEAYIVVSGMIELCKDGGGKDGDERKQKERFQFDSKPTLSRMQVMAPPALWVKSLPSTLPPPSLLTVVSPPLPLVQTQPLTNGNRKLTRAATVVLSVRSKLGSQKSVQKLQQNARRVSTTILRRASDTVARISGQADASKHRAALVRLPAGSWFGEEALTSQTTRSYSAVAVRQSSLVVLSRDMMAELSRLFPADRTRIADGLASDAAWAGNVSVAAKTRLATRGVVVLPDSPAHLVWELLMLGLLLYSVVTVMPLPSSHISSHLSSHLSSPLTPPPSLPPPLLLLTSHLSSPLLSPLRRRCASPSGRGRSPRRATSATSSRPTPRRRGARSTSAPICCCCSMCCCGCSSSRTWTAASSSPSGAASRAATPPRGSGPSSPRRCRCSSPRRAPTSS